MGANHGLFSLFAALVGAQKIVTVEPQASLCRYIMDSITRQKAGQVITLYNNAVLDTRSMVGMANAAVNEGAIGTVVIGGGNIQSVTIPELVPAGVTTISYLKIDVEGFDIAAIRCGCLSRARSLPWGCPINTLVATALTADGCGASPVLMQPCLLETPPRQVITAAAAEQDGVKCGGRVRAPAAVAERHTYTGYYPARRGDIGDSTKPQVRGEDASAYTSAYGRSVRGEHHSASGCHLNAQYHAIRAPVSITPSCFLTASSTL